MSNNQIPLLIPAAARTAQAELFKTLRDADNPAAWMVFMETVTRLLPDVLSAGRPSAEAIQRSPIGQLGFKSWADMIEAPAEHNGLAWNQSAWKAWRRAWAVVQQYPWLRSQPFSSSEINTLAQDCKRAGVDFPASAEALEDMKKGAKEAADQRKTESAAALTKRLEVAENAAREARAAAAALRQQLAESASREHGLSEEIGALKGQLSLAVVEIDRLQRLQVVPQDGASPTSPEQPRRRSWWQRLLSLFGLGS